MAQDTGDYRYWYSGDNMIIVTPGANLALTPEAVQVSLEKYRHKHHHSAAAAAAAGVVVLLVQLEIPYDAALQALKAYTQLKSLDS